MKNMGFEQGLEKKKEGGANQGEALIRDYTVTDTQERLGQKPRFFFVFLTNFP